MTHLVVIEKEIGGDTCHEDKKINDENVDRCVVGSVIATYIYEPTNTAIQIITESDKSVTTIQFKNKY